MKHIQKRKEPESFKIWKNLKSDDWQPSYSNLQNPEKRDVHEALMADQGLLCCYCEGRLSKENSHIEHFKPQSDPEVDPLDYSNLICSCQKHLKKGEPRHCGNLKADWFDDRILISPLDEGCEKRFKYTGDGHIAPESSDDIAAIETIRHLGLDLSILCSRRAKAIEPFLSEYISEEDFIQLVKGYLEISEKGVWEEYYTTIEYLFGKIVT